MLYRIAKHSNIAVESFGECLPMTGVIGSDD